MIKERNYVFDNFLQKNWIKPFIETFINNGVVFIKTKRQVKYTGRKKLWQKKK